VGTVEKLNTIRNQVSDEEWQMRVDLAACYRLIAMYGWDDLVFTHISARVPGPDEHFLINSYGLMFEEMTASSLVKIDLEGNKVMDIDAPINPAGFTIHSAVHEAREDVDYEGIALNEEEKPRLVADLGDKSSLILRNHGLLTVGENIPDAFLTMYALETACQAQVMAQSCGGPLIEVDGKILAAMAAQADESTNGLGGMIAWPALLRKLDRLDASYRD